MTTTGAGAAPEHTSVLTRIRIWLPDAPGVLGAVAAEIGAVQGNVVGLEVLEREAGVAIDEMVVELPDDPGAIDAVCRGVRNVPGVGVEEVVELVRRGEAPDREDTVLAATTAILGAATPDAVLKELTGRLRSLFGLDWLAVADDAFDRLRRGARRRTVAGLGRRVRGRGAQRRRPGQRHDRLGRLRGVRPRHGAGRLRRADRRHPAP